MLVFVIIANALALLATAWLIPQIKVDSFLTAVIAAVVLGVLNTFIRPFLEFLAIPANLLTFGLFSWVISAAILLLTSALVPGFEVQGFLAALVGGVVLAFIASLLQSLVKK